MSARDAVRGLCWIDGGIVPLERPVLPADDSAFASGLGCYTTARIAAGRVRFEDRHVQRLVEGARVLGLGRVDAATLRRAFAELAGAALPDGEGAVRLQLSRGSAGRARVVGLPRGLEPDPATWSAVLAPLPHDGAQLAGGLKVTSRLTLVLAAESARERGADEALLLDADDRLVEAARSSVFVATADGALATPPLARGGVAGIARALVLERVPGCEERDVTRAELGTAREIVAVNAVRGARAVTRLDGRAVGNGRPGPACERLATALARD